MPIALSANHIPSWPVIAVQINTRAPNDPLGTDNWLDATSYVSKMSIQRGKSDELTTMGPGTMTLELIGTQGQWDPDNAASPFYPYLTAWRQVRVLVTWLGVTYPLFTGYNTDGWTTAFASRGRREYGKAQFSDALAVLERIGLLDVTLAEMLADGPLALYPLDESGGLLAGNRSAFKQDNATIRAFSGVTAALGATSPTPSSGSTGLALTQTTALGAVGFTPAMLNLPAGSIPTISAGATWEFWLNAANPTALFTNSLLFACTNPSTGNGIQLFITTGGTFTAQIQSASGAASVNYTLPADGTSTFVAIVLNAARTQMSLYINGVLIGTTTALGTALAQADLTTLNLAAFSSTATVTLSYANIATYSSPLSGARILAHYAAGLNAFYGDTPAVRIARLLSYPKWLTALQNLDTTSTSEITTPLLGATGLDGVTVAAELLHIADSTLSDVDVDGSGRVRYRSRDYRLLQTTPSVIFGPNTGAGEIPYSEPAPEIGKNPKFTYPQVQVQQRNGITALGSDATAVTNNFEQMLTKSDVILADPSMVLDLRDDLLRRYKDKHNRATPVTLNPAANPSIWPAVLGLDTAQRCRVNVTPQTAPAKSVEGYVEAFTHEVDPTSSTPWTVTVTTSAAPPFFPWILGDSVYSVLGVTTIPTF